MSPQPARYPEPAAPQHAPRRRGRLVGIMVAFAACCLLVATSVMAIARIAALISWSWWLICAPAGMVVGSAVAILAIGASALAEIEHELTDGY